MPMLKIQKWVPDTHLGISVEIEWEYDKEAGRDTGREHRGVSVRYPDGTYIHRDTQGPDVAHEHYRKILAENVVKNRAYKVIVASLPMWMKKTALDSDGDPVLDRDGHPCMTVKDKYKPRYKHLGSGRYEFMIPDIDEETYKTVTSNLSQFLGSVALLKPTQWCKSNG